MKPQTIQLTRSINFGGRNADVIDLDKDFVTDIEHVGNGCVISFDNGRQFYVSDDKILHMELSTREQRLKAVRDAAPKQTTKAEVVAAITEPAPEPKPQRKKRGRPRKGSAPKS